MFVQGWFELGSAQRRPSCPPSHQADTDSQPRAGVGAYVRCLPSAQLCSSQIRSNCSPSQPALQTCRVRSTLPTHLPITPQGHQEAGQWAVRAGGQGGRGGGALTCGRGGPVALRGGGLVALESLGEGQANTGQQERTEGLHGNPGRGRTGSEGSPTTHLGMASFHRGGKLREDTEDSGRKTVGRGSV